MEGIKKGVALSSKEDKEGGEKRGGKKRRKEGGGGRTEELKITILDAKHRLRGYSIQSQGS